MNIYLVDFENVNSQGLNGINRLDSGDRIIIFYSENANSMTFELHEQINQSKAYIFFQKVDVGTKNALDFQLATYLGYLICENEKAGILADYYVVTKDRGYSSLITYWTKRDVNITLVGTLIQSMRIQKERSIERRNAAEGSGERAAGKTRDRTAGLVSANAAAAQSGLSGTQEAVWADLPGEPEASGIAVQEAVSDETDAVVAAMAGTEMAAGMGMAAMAGAETAADEKKAAQGAGQTLTGLISEVTGLAEEEEQLEMAEAGTEETGTAEPGAADRIGVGETDQAVKGLADSEPGSADGDGGRINAPIEMAEADTAEQAQAGFTAEEEAFDAAEQESGGASEGGEQESSGISEGGEKESGGASDEDEPEKKPARRTRSRSRAKAEPAVDTELRIKVEQAVPDKDVVDLVVSYIKKYKTKLGINNALAKEFKDSKKASEIYKSIKPLIADKKGQ